MAGIIANCSVAPPCRNSTAWSAPTPEQRAQVGLGLLDDPLEGRRTVADLHHRHARPRIVEKLRLGLLEHAERQDGGSGSEVVGTLQHRGHSGLCYRNSGRLGSRFSGNLLGPASVSSLRAGRSAVSGLAAGGAFRELMRWTTCGMMGVRPTLKTLVESYERRVIEEALRASNGNQRQAARAPGRPADDAAREDEAPGSAPARGASRPSRRARRLSPHAAHSPTRANISRSVRCRPLPLGPWCLFAQLLSSEST